MDVSVVYRWIPGFKLSNCRNTYPVIFFFQFLWVFDVVWKTNHVHNSICLQSINQSFDQPINAIQSACGLAYLMNALLKRFVQTRTYLANF